MYTLPNSFGIFLIFKIANVKKSNLLLFNLDRNRTKEKPNIYLDTEVFEQKEFANYLGIYIDENLS